MRLTRALARLDAKGQIVSIPSAEAGGVRRERRDLVLKAAGLCEFQSPPPKRGACDWTALRGTSRFLVSIPSAEAGGVRPVRPFWDWVTSWARWFQSPPPKRGACDVEDSFCGVNMTTNNTSFNPLRRSGGRATPVWVESAAGKKFVAFQSPPPKRGACDA